MKNGIDLKAHFGVQKYILYSKSIQFQIRTSTKDEAKFLAKLSHDCGSASFELIIVKKLSSTSKNDKNISTKVANASSNKIKSEQTITPISTSNSTKVEPPKKIVNKRDDESRTPLQGAGTDPALFYKEDAFKESTLSFKSVVLSESKRIVSIGWWEP